MKNSFITLLVCLNVSLYAQTTTPINFIYDASGNRIQRSYGWLFLQEGPGDPGTVDAMLANVQASADQIEEFGAVDADELQPTVVKVFPNPTQDWLEVQTPQELVAAELMIYDLNGRLILRQAYGAGHTKLDLSFQPAGTYLLVLRAKDFHSQWKIIKY